MSRRHQTVNEKSNNQTNNTNTQNIIQNYESFDQTNMKILSLKNFFLTVFCYIYVYVFFFDNFLPIKHT